MYNQLRSLAFRLDTGVIANSHVLSAHPFWVLDLPEELKSSIRQALAKASNRPEDQVYLPIRVLNQAARMLIPDILSISRNAGQAGIQPWLYASVVEENDRGPASSEAMKQIVRSWIRTLQKVPSDTRNTLVQQVTANTMVWRREVIDLTRWDLAKNETAKPYVEHTVMNDFVVLPDIIAARLSKESIRWGTHQVTFRRAPLSPGQSGVELVSWPPLEYTEEKTTWLYSVVLTFTLQTVPFQPFPELHCEVGIRRWAGPEITVLPGGMETSVYLLDWVPWIEGQRTSHSFQVAPITWEYVPSAERKDGAAYRLNWDSDLVALLNALHPKETFPDPQSLKENPYDYIYRDKALPSKPSAAIVFRNGIKPPHGAGPGVMPRDRYHFAEQVAALLRPEFVFIPPFQRKDYRVSIPSNPFFSKEKDDSVPNEIPLVGTDANRRRAVAQTTAQITMEIRYQTEEIHQALREAIHELLGYPLLAENGYIWATPEIVVSVRSQPLGSWGAALSLKDGGQGTQYDRLRESIAVRANALADATPLERGMVGVLVELDKEQFDGYDPKPAIRIGLGRKGYHTQFITPQPNKAHLTDKEQSKLQNQLKERSRSAVRDLLRQFGVLGLLPKIHSRPLSKKRAPELVIPDPLHYLGFWLIKQQAKSSSTHIAQTLPVLVHMASNTPGVQVMAPGFRNWLPYHDALLTLVAREAPVVLKPAEIQLFLLESLELCLPVFGDTLLFCHAQNVRGIWKWLNNEQITRTLPPELSRYPQLRIVRLRTGDHEIPEWYAQNEKEAYGSSQGIFSIGESGHVFASVQEKPPTAMNLSKELSKAFPRTKLDKKTQEPKVYAPSPNVAAWNAGIVEMTVACANHDEAFMGAVVANELRHHFASHFGAPTIFPLPLHLASLVEEYVLPVTKPLKSKESAQWDNEE